MSLPSIHLMVLKLKLSNFLKYLGICLDSSLTFKQYVKQMAQKLKIKLGFLYQIKACFCLEDSTCL